VLWCRKCYILGKGTKFLHGIWYLLFLSHSIRHFKKSGRIFGLNRISCKIINRYIPTFILFYCKSVSVPGLVHSRHTVRYNNYVEVPELILKKCHGIFPKDLVSLFLTITAFFSTFMANILRPCSPLVLQTWKTLPKPPVPKTFLISKSSRQTGGAAGVRFVTTRFSATPFSTGRERIVQTWCLI
jgi:hypothetical protein